VIAPSARNRRLTKARLIPREAIRAAIKAPLSTAQCLPKRYPISVRHHIVQNGIYCAANDSKGMAINKLKIYDIWRVNFFHFSTFHYVYTHNKMERIAMASFSQQQ
jgi:hypothetical protein